MKKRVVVIGAGFSGLSAACFLAKHGYSVEVVEKHRIPGGRARKHEYGGFVFDMGPSWYWMPDVFERFFAAFGDQVSKYYHLQKLDPSFSIVFKEHETIEVPSDPMQLHMLFESIERGSSEKLTSFMEDARYKYQVAMQDLIYRPGLSWKELLDLQLIRGSLLSGLLRSYKNHVRQYFSDTRLIQLLEFPVLFLGGTPSTVPALYSLMAYAGFMLGTWYPQGGMYSVVDAMHNLAKDMGVHFSFEEEVIGIEVEGGKATGVRTARQFYKTDHIIASADYHHIEQEILDPHHRKYSKRYWENRVLAPTALIFFIGIDRRLEKLRHHTLFFDAAYEAHAEKIYNHPGLPDEPLFYVCTPSVTDASVAPEGCENLFILIPLSTELEDTDALRNACFEKVMLRLESHVGMPVRQHIIYQRSYAMRDFKMDYHALKGNAYGLANTLLQTAVLKPRMKSEKLSNLYYTGQLTVPGPGVPPALISGEIAAKLIVQHDQRIKKTAQRAAAAL